MDIGVLKLDLKLEKAIEDLRSKWGNSSMVTYTGAHAGAHENENIILLVRGTASAKNLNLDRCTDAVREFTKSFNIESNFATTWYQNLEQAEITELVNASAVLVQIQEQSNPRLNFSCYWHFGSESVNEYK